MVTPHNPLKVADELLDEDLRLEMVRLALEDYDRVVVSDAEFHLPRPSYTIDTLTKLSADHPDRNFTLIIGGDNWMRFNKWREYKQLMEQYQIIVYPRVGAEVVIPPQYRHTIRLVDAPLVEISSTLSVTVSGMARRCVHFFLQRCMILSGKRDYTVHK